MKKTIKVFTAIMLITALVFSIASCGLDVKKITGDWTVETLNGKTIAECAAESGYPEYFYAQNYTFTEKTVVGTGCATGSIQSTPTYDLTVRADGVEVIQDGNVIFSFVYDEKNDKLTMGLDNNGVKYSYVYKRGSTDLQALLDAANGGAEEAPAEENYEGGEEEYSEEGYGEEAAY